MAFLPIISAILYGLSYAIYHKHIGKISISTIMLVAGGFSITASLLIAKVTKESYSFEFLEYPKASTLLIAAIIAPIVGWNISVFAVNFLPASYVAMLEICYPLFTVLFLFVLFNVNHFNVYTIAGGLIVLFGSLLLIYGNINDPA